MQWEKTQDESKKRDCALLFSALTTTLATTIEPWLSFPADTASEEGCTASWGHSNGDEPPGKVRKVRNARYSRSNWVQQGVSTLPQQLGRTAWVGWMEIEPTRGQPGDVLHWTHHTCHVQQQHQRHHVRPPIQLSDNLARLQVSIPDPAGLLSLLPFWEQTHCLWNPQNYSPMNKTLFCLCINWHFTPHIPSSSSFLAGSTLPSLSVFFHSLCCQELNDTAELAHCYGNRFVIGRVDWGRVWNDCGWGHWVLAGWVGGCWGWLGGC